MKTNFVFLGINRIGKEVYSQLVFKTKAQANEFLNKYGLYVKDIKLSDDATDCIGAITEQTIYLDDLKLFEAFNNEVSRIIQARLGTAKDASIIADHLIKECTDFIKYCAESFVGNNRHKEANKCAVGIIAKLDSQSHPDRYTNYDMSSMFDVHRLGRIILETEDIVAIDQLEKDIIAYLANRKE